MIAEVTAAALMSENKQPAPGASASIDSTPTSANQEDACLHGLPTAPGGCHPMVDHLGRILGIELLAAAQGGGNCARR